MGKFSLKTWQQLAHDPAHEGIIKTIEIDLSSIFTDKKYAIYGHQIFLVNIDPNMAAELTLRLHSINNIAVPIQPFSPIEDIYIEHIFLTNSLAQERTAIFLITEPPTRLNYPAINIAADLIRPASIYETGNGGGTEPEIIIPDNETWKLQSIFCEITAGVGVGNRNFHVLIVDTPVANLLFEFQCEYDQVASETVRYLGSNLAIEDSTPNLVGGRNILRFPLPNLVLKSGGKITLHTNTFSHSGDAYRAWFLIQRYKFPSYETIV